MGNRKSHAAKDNVLATGNTGLPGTSELSTNKVSRFHTMPMHLLIFSLKEAAAAPKTSTNEQTRLAPNLKKTQTSESRVKNTPVTAYYYMFPFPVEWKKLEKRNGKHPPPFFGFDNFLRKSLNIQSNRKGANTHLHGGGVGRKQRVERGLITLGRTRKTAAADASSLRTNDARSLASGDAPLYPSNNPRRVEFRRRRNAFFFSFL